jgi:hypothetical protein
MIILHNKEWILEKDEEGVVMWIKAMVTETGYPYHLRVTKTEEKEWYSMFFYRKVLTEDGTEESSVDTELWRKTFYADDMEQAKFLGDKEGQKYLKALTEDPRFDGDHPHEFFAKRAAKYLENNPIL